MATILTNYTTYDMAYYYRDTKRLTRLSKEEEYTLIASLATPTSPSLPAQQTTQVKQRLIEGHLGLATCIAADLARRCVISTPTWCKRPPGAHPGDQPLRLHQ